MKKRHLLDAIRRHRNVVFLIVSALLLPLFTELASSWLQTTLGRTPSQLLQLLAIVVSSMVTLGVLYWALGKQRPLELVPEEARPERFAGLIVLVGMGQQAGSRKTLSHDLAIAYHLDQETAGGEPLRVCWLIATGGERGSVTVAMEVRDKYRHRCTLHIRTLRDAFDVEEAYQVVHDIYTHEATEQGLTPEQIIADFTGGTKPMTAGMVLACRERWPMQYMTGGTPPIASLPVRVRFSPG